MSAPSKKPPDISQEDWDAVDVPELSDAELAEMRPFKEVFPDLYEDWKKHGAHVRIVTDAEDKARARRGGPPVASPKVHISFRLAADVVDSIRATGRGYNARVEEVLRAAFVSGKRKG